MGFSTNYKNDILEHACGIDTDIDYANETWLGLSTADPGDDGANMAEPTANGYARVLLGNASQPLTQKMGSASNGSITNAEAIMFPEATGAWGTLTHFGIFSAESNGTYIGGGALNNSISPVAGNVPLFRAGDFTWSIN